MGGWVYLVVGDANVLGRDDVGDKGVFVAVLRQGSDFFLGARDGVAWVGGWVSGWVVEEIAENEAVGMRCWTLWEGGWVGKYETKACMLVCGCYGWMGGLPGRGTLVLQTIPRAVSNASKERRWKAPSSVVMRGRVEEEEEEEEEEMSTSMAVVRTLRVSWPGWVGGWVGGREGGLHVVLCKGE